MAATIATATTEDKARTKETHRLGSLCATGEAATWRTVVTPCPRPLIVTFIGDA